MAISSLLRKQILSRSNYRCEYCKTSSRITGMPLVMDEHFIWVNGGVSVAGLSDRGRATVIALRLNNEDAVSARMLWVLAGWHPPSA